MEFLSLGIALVGIGLAIYIPLKVEALKRPQLRIEWAADANNPSMYGGPTRIAHIAVVNEPIEGRLGKWLLRNPATGCQVKLTYKSRSDEQTFTTPGKWGAKAEPVQWLPTERPDGTLGLDQYVNVESMPDTMVYDLPPGRRGSTVAIALKRDGERQAYAFSWRLYASLPDRPLSDSESALYHDAYEVDVEVDAGGIGCAARFLLHNEGDHHTGLRLDRDPL